MNTNTVRVAIISDTHGFIDPNVIAVIKTCSHVVHAGDICGAHVLEQFGERVQQSVFECRLEGTDIERLTTKLEETLGDPAIGNIRAYRICADCLELAFGIGAITETQSGRSHTVV